MMGGIRGNEVGIASVIRAFGEDQGKWRIRVGGGVKVARVETAIHRDLSRRPLLRRLNVKIHANNV